MQQTGNYLCNRLTGIDDLRPPEGQPLGVWCHEDGNAWCGQDSNATGIPETLLPQAYFENTLLSISKTINDSDNRAWQYWYKRLPIDSNLRDKLVERREEVVLGSAMPHLEEVCRNPRAHLTVSELREPVSRARRVSPRAIGLLSAHSEDWHSRTFRSVRPKVVLSEVVEDEWAIYENRALRTLRTQILEAFTPRLLELRELLSAIDRSSDEGAFGYRFRIFRLCLLLSELLQNEEEKDLLRSLFARLTATHKSLLGLGGTFLLKAIRHSPPVATPLRPTNILRDDKRYRKVFELWHLWERREEDKITRAERLTRLSTAMDRYAAILCARSFMLLDMVIQSHEMHTNAMNFEPGAVPVKLKRGWAFTWNKDGTFSLLRKNGEIALRIVAISCQVERLPVRMITEMAGLKENSHIEAYPTMILTLGKCDNPPATWPEELVNWYRVQDRSLTLLPKRILLEVSPSSLDSVELVARLLRRIIAEADWPELPIKANLPAGIDTASAGISITVHKAFKTAPSLEQIEQIADLLKDAIFKIGSIEQRLNDIVRIQRGRVGNNAKDLAQEKGRLQTELLALKENLNVWQKLLEELNRIRSIILPAMTCPCCGHQTSQPPQASMFSCSYGPSCKTRWGKRADAMGQMHVFLMPNGEDPILQSEKENPIDRYGSDFI